MRFISDYTRFPQHGNLNNDNSNFWGFTSGCLQRMLEDVGFAAKRKEVWGSDVYIDAERVVFDDAGTRLSLAYGRVEAIPVGSDRNEPEAWTIV